MNVAQLLERSALYHADRVALVAGDRRWTYRELDAAASTLAGGLAGLGLAPDERLALHLPNGPEFVLAYYAAQKVGLVPLSLNVTYRAEEIEYIVRDAQAAAVITAGPVAGHLPAPDRIPSVRHVLDAKDLDVLRGAAPRRALERDREATAAILYTSATTGRPKGVMLTHANVVSNVWATVHRLRMTADDRGLCALPLFHCFGQNFILNALVAAGGTLVLQERFVPDLFLDAVARHRVTLLYAVPTMYILFLESGAPPDLSSVRLCFSAAATLPADVERRWHERHVLHPFEKPLVGHPVPMHVGRIRLQVLLVAGLSDRLQHTPFFGDLRVSAVAVVSGQIVVHHVAHLMERGRLKENLRLFLEKARGDVDDEGLVAHLLVAHHFREDIADARGIVEAYDAATSRGDGVIRYQGMMIDVPIVVRARRVIARAEAIKAQTLQRR